MMRAAASADDSVGAVGPLLVRIAGGVHVAAAAVVHERAEGPVEALGQQAAVGV